MVDRLAEDAFVRSAQAADPAIARSTALQLLSSGFSSSRTDSAASSAKDVQDSATAEGDAAFGSWISSTAGAGFQQSKLEVRNYDRQTPQYIDCH